MKTKKFLMVLLVVLSLLIGAMSASAHCTGPHGPINIPKDDKK